MNADDLIRARLEESDEHPWVTAAKKHFGTTRDHREAGFVTPAGEMIDMSGKNNGGPAGKMMLDHRDIQDAIPESDWEADPGVGLRKFMATTGSARIRSWGDGQFSLHVNRRLTTAQRQTIARIPAQEIGVDVSHPHHGVTTYSTGLDPHRHMGRAIRATDDAFDRM